MTIEGSGLYVSAIPGGLVSYLYLLVVAFAAAHAGAATSLCEPFQMREVQSTAAPNTQSFLWRIAKPGTQDSYLLGTFHAGGAQIRENWEALPLIFSRARVLVAETDFQDTTAREFNQLSVDPASSLATSLGSEFYESASKILERYGLPGSAIQSMKPWRAFLQMAGVPREPASLDALLVQQARARSLPVYGLQSASEMVQSMEVLSRGEQLQVLKETICNYEAVQAQSQTLERLYGQDAAHDFSIESSRLTSPVPDLTQKLETALVRDRNRIFLPRLIPKLEAGGAVVALGAGHLFGEGGMIELLRASGYTVTPVDRRAFAADLFAEANQNSVQPLSGLLDWLRSAGLQIPVDYATPKIIFASSDSVAKPGCDDACEMAMDGKTLNVAVANYTAVQGGDPNTLADLLAYLIRDVQEWQAGEIACTAWQQKNVQSVILRSRYLASRGTASAGLRSLPLPDCH